MIKKQFSNTTTHPPLAKLVVRVGVTGHRPNGLKDANMEFLRQQISITLSKISDIVREIHNNTALYYEDSEPVLRIISPLAEGSDRIVAREALKLDYELQCPLPFAQQHYEEDFVSPESRAEFHDLLQQSTTILELDGQLIDKDSAYHAVGRVVLNQCDVLIAIWDGEEARGVGGTAQIVKEAQSSMIPTVWIQAQQPHKVCLKDSTDEWNIGVRAHLVKLITPMQGVNSPKKSENMMDRYLKEKQRKLNWGFPYKLFRDLVGDGQFRVPPAFLGNFEQETRDEWQQVWTKSPGMSPDLARQLEDKYIKYYAWADKLADYYANLYRSSFITTYICSGLAVLCALIPYAMEKNEALHYKEAPTIAEVLIICLIIAVTTMANRYQWHKRWIDYRILAELLRQMRFLAPLGMVTASFRVQAHASIDDIRNSWVNWYFRAIVREAGLMNVKIDHNYLNSYLMLLIEGEIEGQVRFHDANRSRYHRICHRLHNTGNILFGMTFVAAITHLFYHNATYRPWLTLIAAVFPAFGAAVAGILFQGEFERLEQRSGAMYTKLEELYSWQGSSVLSFSDLQIMAEDTEECMMTEVLDWHLMFKARPLKLPA